MVLRAPLASLRRLSKEQASVLSKPPCSYFTCFHFMSSWESSLVTRAPLASLRRLSKEQASVSNKLLANTSHAFISCLLERVA